MPLYDRAVLDIGRYLTRVRGTHRHSDLQHIWLGRDGGLRADSISKIFIRISKLAGVAAPGGTDL